MLNLQHISKSFRDKLVLDDVTLSVHAGETIALVGDNGVGKTTLLNIMLGKLRPDTGDVLLADETVGYVPQTAILGTTIADSLGRHIKPWRRDYTLALVGLEHTPPDMPVKSLSGGQKTRLAFATILAADPEPTMLLLDEPTNNLDSEGLAWLQQFVRNFHGGILLVSHDRAFINAVATKVVALHNGKLKQYGGNYDFYKQQKESEHQAAAERYQASIDERKRIEKGMRSIQDRARQGLRQRKPKDNDKAQFDWHQDNVQRSFSGQLKAVQSRLDQLEEVEQPESGKSYMVNLSGDVPRHKLILRLQAVRKTYQTEILQGIDMEVRGNERIHIIGPNGSGKTTLLKIAAGLLRPDSGTVMQGSGVSAGYFSQDVDGLDHEETALKNLQMVKAGQTAIYRQAKSLGLTEQDLAKRVSELSRGQQAKLSFAKLLLDAHQLLILDEPTNHLDIATRERIEEALRHYDGALLFASHDDYFVKTLRPTRTLHV